MNTNNVGTEGFNLFEILYNRWPLLVPVILDEAAGTIMVLVDPPDDKLSTRFVSNKTVAILVRANPLKFRLRR